MDPHGGVVKAAEKITYDVRKPDQEICLIPCDSKNIPLPFPEQKQ